MEEKEQRRSGADEGTQKDHHRPSPCIDHFLSPTRELGAPIEYQKEDRDHEKENTGTTSCKRTGGRCEYYLRCHDEPYVIGLMLFICHQTPEITASFKINLETLERSLSVKISW